MLVELIGEGIGTFFFLGVILASGGNPLVIALGLAAAIYLVSKVSSVHLNGTISLIMYLKGEISLLKCLSYILVQVIGGLLALIWYNQSKGVILMK